MAGKCNLLYCMRKKIPKRVFFETNTLSKHLPLVGDPWRGFLTIPAEQSKFNCIDKKYKKCKCDKRGSKIMGLAFEAINPDIFPVALELFRSGMDRSEIAGEIFKKFGKKWDIPNNKFHTSMIDLSITEAESCFNFSVPCDVVGDGLNQPFKNKLEINGSYDWISVKKEDETIYLFPDDHKLLKKWYKNSVIYKWNIYDKKGKLKSIYIGEIINLRNRISGYLKPGPTQQTNIRINKLFNEFIIKKYVITLDILFFEKIAVNNEIIHFKDLNNNDIRKALEHLLIVINKSKEYKLLNL